MQVRLDHEQWEADGQATMAQVLADVSERAHAKARIVTSLTVDQRVISDRDLDDVFLGEAAIRYARLVACSQSQEELMQAAQASIGKFAAEIRQEGSALVGRFRRGEEPWGQLDLWMGKLADYVELRELQASDPTGKNSPAAFVQDLLKARSAKDTMLIADVLEYDLLAHIVAS